MEAKYGKDGLAVVGVHTPKYDDEKDPGRVQRVADRYGLSHPVYLDNDASYIGALGRGWRPLFFLVDRQGNIRHRAQGTVREDSASGKELEAVIQELLAE